jgi:hypothetical protein
VEEVMSKKRKHTDESKPGPDMDEARFIANAVAYTLASLLTELSHVARDAIAMEVAAAAWRLVESEP